MVRAKGRQAGRVGSDIKVMIFLHIGNFYPVNVKDV